MSKNMKQGLVPALRFPEFREAGSWEEALLGDLGNFIGGGTPSKTEPEYWQGHIPWISSSDISDESISNYTITRFITNEAIKNSATKLIPKGSILLVSRVGVGKLAVSEEPLCTSQDFTSLITSKDNSMFLGYYLKANSRKLDNLCQGMAIKGFTKEDVSNLSLYIPQLKEQQKVSECLSSLDELIIAHTQKHEALQSYKKGMLQNLFPAEGESVPALRFAEFRGSGDWKPGKLGDKDISDFVKKRISLSDLSIETYVSTENILANFGGIAKASKLPPSGSFTAYKSGDILIANIRPYLKKVWVANRSGGASNDVVVVRPKKGNAFLSCILRNEAFINYVMQGAKGVKMPRGDIDLMKEYPIAVPNPDEQHKIAECLSSIDDLIRAQAQKIEELKAHKKGLMQKLFPSVDEVGA
ncbi:MAG: restriction endonuclease subunit S [Aestuariibacter sp.]